MSTQLSTRGCTVLAPGEGEKFWLVTDLVTPFVTAEQTGGVFEAVGAVSVVKGGPPPHIHHREDELFYVVDGEYTFVFEDKTMRAGPGTCMFLPRGKVHTFANVGEKPGRMVVAVTPAGFGKAAFAGSQPCTDPTCPPELSAAVMEKLGAACAAHEIEFKPGWKADQPFPPCAKPRELWVIGQHIKILLTSKETRGQFSVVEITSLTDDAVPVHFHHREDEMFYVLEGTYEFDVAGRKVKATPGTFIYVPRKTPHGFRNAGSTPAKLVDWHTPGGFEKFFEASGTVCTDIAQGPPRVAPDFARFIQICLEHGMELPR